MSDLQNRTSIYELSLNVLVTWQAHSLSNAGNNGSNRLLARRQLLADGQETDACSGNIAKHHHAVLLAEYLESAGVPLCPACRARDGRRAAALVEHPAYKKNLTMHRIINECGLCDAHGFLVTAKNSATDGSTESRERLSKHTLINYSFALALPDQHQESTQLYTRMGDSKENGQMIMKAPGRSGQYAFCVRYKCAGIGLDTDKWIAFLDNSEERVKRHGAILLALRDQILSPSGAQIAKMLPHLAGLVGAIVVRKSVGRAPIYSPLDANFITQLQANNSESCMVSPFNSASEFIARMNELIETTEPVLPPQSLPVNKSQDINGSGTSQAPDRMQRNTLSKKVKESK